jgi:hypothetical protein
LGLIWPALLLSAAGCGQNFDLTLPTTVPAQVIMPAATVEVPSVIVENLTFVDVTVNGAGPYRFVLDTRAALGQISPTISDQFPGGLLNRSTTTAGPIGTTEAFPLFRVDSLEIGGIQFENFAVIIRDVPGMFSNLPFTVDGIIGSGLFRNVVLTLNYPGRTIRVQNGVLPAVDGCTILPLSGGDLDADGVYILPQVSIQALGQTLTAFLDSGNAAALLLPESFAGSAFSSPPTTVNTLTQNGATPLLRGALNGNITLGCIQMDHPTVLVGGSLTSLGAAGLQTLVVTIDQSSKSVRFVQP